VPTGTVANLGVPSAASRESGQRDDWIGPTVDHCSFESERQTKRLVKQLERLGHHVTLTEEAAAA
jgi:hypothetical protein